jgi:hypothetical protein
MTVPQITVRLSPAAKVNFQAYADRLGVRASELAKLLIVRERNLRRLKDPERAGDIARPPVRSNKGRLPTVTAHCSRIGEVEEFDAYARSCGLNRNTAGLWLLETELQESWLENALSRP